MFELLGKARAVAVGTPYPKERRPRGMGRAKGLSAPTGRWLDPTTKISKASKAQTKGFYISGTKSKKKEAEQNGTDNSDLRSSCLS
jgi:hypothetical protein